MGTDEAAGRGASRLPDDVRQLAQRAASLESERPALKAELAKLHSLGQFGLAVREGMATALVEEGWEPDDARKLTDEVVSKGTTGTKARTVSDDERESGYASDALTDEHSAWDEELKRKYAGAPLWKKLPMFFVVRPVAFVVAFVLSVIVGIFDPTDWRGSGGGG